MSKLLWQPSEARIKASNMYRFMTLINQRYGTSFGNYERALPVVRRSYSRVLERDVGGSPRSRPRYLMMTVIDDAAKMPGARAGLTAPASILPKICCATSDERPALIFRGEDRVRRTFTYAQLYDEVARVAQALKQAGVKAGDRVAGFVPNMPESIIAMLAATSLGAAWSSCSPDFGIKGVLDRFGQIRPKVLFTADGYFFKGKPLDSLARIADIISQIPIGGTAWLSCPTCNQEQPDISAIPRAVMYRRLQIGRDDGLEIDFEQLPFDHPLYVMYSSGTTGLPKCMVQSAGGILIHHLKRIAAAHRSQTRGHDFLLHHLRMDDVELAGQFSLATGATLVLYDGNPFHPSPRKPCGRWPRMRKSPFSEQAPATWPRFRPPVSSRRKNSI